MPGALIKRFLARRGESGSEFGGGAFGIRNRETEMASRGSAPFTGSGLLAALGNAFSAVASPMKTGFGSVLRSSGVLPTTGIGGWLSNRLAGGFSNIPGRTPFDKDLMDAIRSGRMRLGEASRIMGERRAATTRKDTMRGSRETGGGFSGGGGGPAASGGSSRGKRGE